MKYVMILLILILTSCMCSVEEQVQVKSKPVEKSIPVMANTPSVERFTVGDCIRQAGADSWDAYTYKINKVGKYSYLGSFYAQTCEERDDGDECIKWKYDEYVSMRSIPFDTRDKFGYEFEKVTCEK